MTALFKAAQAGVAYAKAALEANRASGADDAAIEAAMAKLVAAKKVLTASSSAYSPPPLDVTEARVSSHPHLLRRTALRQLQAASPLYRSGWSCDGCDRTDHCADNEPLLGFAWHSEHDFDLCGACVKRQAIEPWRSALQWTFRSSSIGLVGSVGSGNKVALSCPSPPSRATAKKSDSEKQLPAVGPRSGHDQDIAFDGAALCLGFYNDSLSPHSRDTIRLEALEGYSNLLALSVNDRVGNNDPANDDKHINASWSSPRGRADIVSKTNTLLNHWSLPLRTVLVEYHYIPSGYRDRYYNSGMETLLHEFLKRGATVHMLVMPGSDDVSHRLARLWECSRLDAMGNPLYASTARIYHALDMVLERNWTPAAGSLVFRPRPRTIHVPSHAYPLQCLPLSTLQRDDPACYDDGCVCDACGHDTATGVHPSFLPPLVTTASASRKEQAAAATTGSTDDNDDNDDNDKSTASRNGDNADDDLSDTGKPNPAAARTVRGVRGTTLEKAVDNDGKNGKRKSKTESGGGMVDVADKADDDDDDDDKAAGDLRRSTRTCTLVTTPAVDAHAVNTSPMIATYISTPETVVWHSVDQYDLCDACGRRLATNVALPLDPREVAQKEEERVAKALVVSNMLAQEDAKKRAAAEAAILVRGLVGEGLEGGRGSGSGTDTAQRVHPLCRLLSPQRDCQPTVSPEDTYDDTNKDTHQDTYKDTYKDTSPAHSPRRALFSSRIGRSGSKTNGRKGASCPRLRLRPVLSFGLWRVCFPPVLIRPDRRLLV